MSGAITAGTLATVAGIGAAGSIGGALIGSNAAGNAAKDQSTAAEQAAQLQYQESQNALDFQKQQWQQGQQNIAPWLQMGGAGLGKLGYLLGLTPDTSLGQANPAFPSSVNPGSINSGFNAQGGLPLGSPGASNPGTARPIGSPLQGPTANAALQSPIRLNQSNPFGSTSPGSNVANPTAGPAIGSHGGAVSGTAINGLPGGLPISVPHASPVAGQGPGGAGAGSAPIGSPSASGGFGSLLSPYPGQFTAPTDITMQNDPGYQSRLALGTDAIQRSAAARGGVLTGGTAKALDTYGQDYASNEYNNVYNRALTGYTTNYNQYENDQANQFNRLAAISGVGQTAANQLSSLGASTANNVSSNLLSTGQNIGQDFQNAGAANASGLIGSANAWGGALGGLGGNLSNLLLLSQLQGGNGSSYYPSDGGALM